MHFSRRHRHVEDAGLSSPQSALRPVVARADRRPRDHTPRGVWPATHQLRAGGRSSATLDSGSRFFVVHLSRTTGTRRTAVRRGRHDRPLGREMQMPEDALGDGRRLNLDYEPELAATARTTPNTPNPLTFARVIDPRVVEKCVLGRIRIQPPTTILERLQSHPGTHASLILIMQVALYQHRVDVDGGGDSSPRPLLR
jgi:hypothetical protein